MAFHPGLSSRLSVVPYIHRYFHQESHSPRAAPTVVQVERQAHVSAGRRDLGHPRLVAVRVRFVEHGQQPRVKPVEGGLEQHRADVPCGYELDEGKKNRARRWRVWPWPQRDGTEDAIEASSVWADRWVWERGG